MSYHVLFSMSTGLSKPMKVPKGTHDEILRHIASVEETLGLQRMLPYKPEGKPQPAGWYWRNIAADITKKIGPEVDRSKEDWHLDDRARDAVIEEICATVQGHNRYVNFLYANLAEWSKKKPKGETEKITHAQSVEFWGGLQILEVPREFWTKDHFTDHMGHLHDLFRKGKSRGQMLDCKPFNAKQTDALIHVLEDELDQWGYDLRFAIPLDENLDPYDRIAASYDGGYDWCSKCGPINSDDFHARCHVCPHAKKGKCDLKNEHPGEFEDEEEKE